VRFIEVEAKMHNPNESNTDNDAILEAIGGES
jgi:hypothetical protein